MGAMVMKSSGKQPLQTWRNFSLHSASAFSPIILNRREKYFSPLNFSISLPNLYICFLFKDTREYVTVPRDS